MIAFGSRYRLARTLAGVRLKSAGGDDGVADVLPAGLIVEACGPAQFYGMIEAKIEDQTFAVYEEDLITASVQIVLDGQFNLYQQHE